MKRISILILSPFRYGGCAASEEETRAPAGMKPRGNRPFIRGIFAFFEHCFFGMKPPQFHSVDEQYVGEFLSSSVPSISSTPE